MSDKIARYTMRSTAEIQAETHSDDGNFEIDAVDDAAKWCRGWEVDRLEMKNSGLRSWCRAQRELCREYEARSAKMEQWAIIMTVISGYLTGWFIAAPQVDKLLVYMGWL